MPVFGDVINGIKQSKWDFEESDLTEDQLRKVARESGAEGAREVLRTLGVDVDQPLEAQKDMHFLRDLRKGTLSVKGKIINTVIGALVLAGLYRILSGLR
ncbi:DUF6127 family protein [uncultured Roseibium sp.]|uniref:DUF6127 family protein n=1 Tax=uncultured Roseibium sp. TaxID=1936171 RepID=UPI00261E18B6|nr:DUF6127 family protein [uncultured Roseibium sp.]